MRKILWGMLAVLTIGLGTLTSPVEAAEVPKVMIDPGHGGVDPGASGNGLQEKVIALKIATMINEHLNSNYEVETKMTRTSDITVSLAQRTDMANAWGADFYLSTHINSGGGTGFEDYTYNRRVAEPATVTESKRIQAIIHTEIKRVLEQYGIRDRGSKEANFHVLRETNMPAVLTEILFIDHAEDSKLLKNDNFLRDIAVAHSVGTAKALNLSDKVIVQPKPEPDPQPESKVYETTADLNVRTGAGTQNAVVTVALKGAKVTITKTQKVGTATWGYGTVNGKNGWMSMDFMKEYKESVTPTPPPTISKVYEITANLNVRSGAGTQNTVVAYASKGTKVTITKTQKVGTVTWGYGTVNGKNGWMSMDFMKEYKEPVAPTPPASTSKVYEITASLNVRSGAGTQNAVVAYASKGTKVTITKTQKVGTVTWGYGTVNGKNGWMSMAYMKEYKAPVTPPPTISKVYTTTASLNVRSGAGTQNAVIAYASKGTKVTITKTQKVGTAIWGYGTVNGKNGWMSMNFMK